MSETLNYSPEQGFFRAVDDAMRAELVASSLAINDGKFSKEPSRALLRLAATDNRFAHWPNAFLRSHRVRDVVSHCYDQHYWRINSGMWPLEMDASLSSDEQHVTANLAEMLLFSRVKEKPTGNTKFPNSPTVNGLNKERVALHTELGGNPETPFFLPGITWASTIRALTDGRVRVGPKMRS